MSNHKNKIIAPQRALKSSWRDECFSKPKVSGGVIKRSLGSRPHAIARVQGVVIGSSNNNSNMY